MLNKKPRRFPVWKSGDGRKTPVNKMEPEHIWNTIRYLERRLESIEHELESAARYAGSGSSDCVQMDADHAMSEAGDKMLATNVWIEVMKNELRRRHQAGDLDLRDLPEAAERRNRSYVDRLRRGLLGMHGVDGVRVRVRPRGSRGLGDSAGSTKKRRTAKESVET